MSLTNQRWPLPSNTLAALMLPPPTLDTELTENAAPLARLISPAIEVQSVMLWFLSLLLGLLCLYYRMPGALYWFSNRGTGEQGDLNERE